MIDSWIRRTAYWTLDSVKGGIVKNQLNEVRTYCKSSKVNKKQLEKILDHAVKTTPAYRSCNPNDFYSFPVLKKETLKQNLENYTSSLYAGQDLIIARTSGSTGMPLMVRWDPEKRARQIADLMYFNETAEQMLGQRFGFFREYLARGQQSWFGRFKQNVVFFDIRQLDDTKLEMIRQRLKAKPYINSCLAYASVYEVLIKYLQQKGDTSKDFHIRSFITNSEVLSMDHKKALKDIIGCRVYDRYSNEENGIIAQTGDLSDEFEVNSASYRMEILKIDSDNPAEYGEVGRIVLTDLYNYADPLIRYDTGDLSIKLEEKDGWVTKIKTIQGRITDMIYDAKGNRVTVCAWSIQTEDLDKVRQYQLIQEGPKQYRFRVNCDPDAYDDAVFIERLRRVLGSEAEITVEHVEEIPKLASGKVKKSVCNYRYDPKDYQK